MVIASRRKAAAGTGPVDTSSRQDPVGPVKLPPVADGELATVLQVDLVERTTTPPKPYTEGDLIKDMRGAAKFVTDAELRKRLRGEIEGIGTAATRGEIIAELLKAGLMESRKGKLWPTAKGRHLINSLQWPLEEAVARTAILETKLALVAEGALPKARFDADFSQEVTEVVNQVAALNNKRQRGAGEKPPPARAGGKAQPPTEKMLAFARAVAARTGKALPTGVEKSFEACKAYLDAATDKPLPPSEKALSFARSIATRKGVPLPEAVQRNAKQLSTWIDANK